MKTRSFASVVILLVAACWLNAGDAVSFEAGKYWVNISQTGSAAYVIRFEISAGEMLQVRTVRAPGIVDASELATKTELRALAEAQVSVPVVFIGEGIGRIWVAVNSIEDDQKVQYLVFDVFNAVRGTEVNERVNSALNRWQNLATNSVMQLGRTPVKCDQELRKSIGATGMFGERKALNGVIFSGSTDKLDGKIDRFNSGSWGLQFVSARVGRVASFIEVGELPPLTREATNRNESSKKNQDDQKAASAGGEKTNTNSKRRNSSSNNSGEKNTPKTRSSDERTARNHGGTKPKSTEVKRPEPKSGPYAGAGPLSSIPGLSVRKDWSAAAGSSAGTGGGHFGETAVSLPNEFKTLSNVASVELVLKIKTTGSAPGMGRISFDSGPMLANARPSGTWYAERFATQGTMLGEFDTRSDDPEYRFDVTSIVESNAAERYFVSVLNLSRTALEITEIRLEVKGEY